MGSSLVAGWQRKRRLLNGRTSQGSGASQRTANFPGCRLHAWFPRLLEYLRANKWKAAVNHCQTAPAPCAHSLLPLVPVTHTAARTATGLSANSMRIISICQIGLRALNGAPMLTANHAFAAPRSSFHTQAQGFSVEANDGLPTCCRAKAGRSLPVLPKRSARH
jgi:hypothetical protein